jgi:hypothetical protein
MVKLIRFTEAEMLTTMSVAIFFPSQGIVAVCPFSRVAIVLPLYLISNAIVSPSLV